MYFTTEYQPQRSPTSLLFLLPLSSPLALNFSVVFAPPSALLWLNGRPSSLRISLLRLPRNQRPQLLLFLESSSPSKVADSPFPQLLPERNSPRNPLPRPHLSPFLLARIQLHRKGSLPQPVTNTQTYHSNSSSLPRASCHSFKSVYWDYSADYSKSAKYRSQEQGTPNRQMWEGWKGLYMLNGQ